MQAVRRPAVAGSFYESDERKLRDFVLSTISSASPSPDGQRAKSYAAPHAGHIYSGKTAGFTYKSLSMNEDFRKCDTIVFVGPNHTGEGPAISISMADWRTPLGVARNNTSLSKAITEVEDNIVQDESAHAGEHSIEVQLPFIQSLGSEKKYCFICMGDQSLDASIAIENAIAGASQRAGAKTMVIASSDFNHYEPLEMTKEKDAQLLKAIGEMDEVRFNDLVQRLDDSICGYGPITVSLLSARRRGATKGMVLDYSTSGDATGDYSSVVAYASIAFV
ncbi:MAG: AmmeMemoRadiSam system protein B [Candidatus Micrarchaeota archaeon]|nr:AmmeMemoRadiSam system protein B [Candidatus Micrarchaeota archaeon]